MISDAQIISSLMGLRKPGRKGATGALPFVQPMLKNRPAAATIVGDNVTNANNVVRLIGFREEVFLDHAARLSSANPTTNYETATTSDINKLSAQENRLLMRASTYTAGLSWDNVTRVVMRMTTNTNASQSLGLLQAHAIKVANAGWTEAGATWNTIDGTAAWAGDVGCGLIGTDYYAEAMGLFISHASELTPRSIYMDMDVDYSEYVAKGGAGFLLLMNNLIEPYDNDPGMRIATDDASSGIRPRLFITRNFVDGDLSSDYGTPYPDMSTPYTQYLEISVSGSVKIGIGESSTPHTNGQVYGEGVHIIEVNGVEDKVVKAQVPDGSSITWSVRDE